MSHKTRGRIRTLLAVPSVAVLMFGATELLAAPAPEARLPNCATFCASYGEAYCEANPTNTTCRYCGFCFDW